MTIFERALEYLHDGMSIGLGSGRAVQAFIKVLGSRVASGLHVSCVPGSSATATSASQAGIPLVSLFEVGELDLAFDGADEVDPQLNLIKGYGRALVREKIIAASARRRVILVGQEKLVSRLGQRGKLPVEVVPFGLPHVLRELIEKGKRAVAFRLEGNLFVSDNGNNIIDIEIGPIDDPARLDQELRAIPGVVATGLFLGLANVVLVGASSDMRFLEEKAAG